MAVVIFAVLALLAFSATSALYLADLFGERERTSEVGRLGLHSSVALTAVMVATLLIDGGLGGVVRSGNVFASLALIIGGGSLAVRTQFPVRTVGALVAPVCAALLVAWLFEQARGAIDADATSLLLGAHIGMALLGVGSFAIAAMLSVMYLVQERQLRRKAFGRLFHRLPSLDALDAASFRLVALGFLIYTIAIVLGMMWLLRIGADPFTARVLVAVLAWVVFGIVIQARLASGWRGRQAAMLTVAGCASTFLVLGMYAL